ncbi:hypothetical protein [Rhizobium leguminosarum]|uniref:hypothetical protein n=1 Tax=Rhizobium leguminosarum TaxID=384 RepID=UPI00143F136F|nr:hypothetical protein [Rhizobium leguminosarum]NKL24573.1 hypothetical protein [Rhizobium leguminosarum bv. viciae]
MSGDALPRGAFVPPTDVVGSGAPLQTVETVSLRIGTDRESLQVEQPVSPGIQLRKITPGSEAAPAFDPAPIETKTSSFLDRITSFIMPKGTASETPLVRLVEKPGQTSDHPAKTEKLESAIDRLEKSQQFATGTTLISSLTQSVMSSSKRLTQGQ